MRVLYVNGYAVFATCIIIAVACAFLAMQFGEYFWRVMKKLSLWWI